MQFANMEQVTDWDADEMDAIEVFDGGDTADNAEWDGSPAITPTPSASSTAITSSTPVNSDKAVSGLLTCDNKLYLHAKPAVGSLWARNEVGGGLSTYNTCSINQMTCTFTSREVGTHHVRGHALLLFLWRLKFVWRFVSLHTR